MRRSNSGTVTREFEESRPPCIVDYCNIIL